MAKAVRADLGKPVEPWIRALEPGSKAIVQPSTSSFSRPAAAIKSFVKQAVRLDSL
jgi:hypothetical protein